MPCLNERPQVHTHTSSIPVEEKCVHLELCNPNMPPSFSSVLGLYQQKGRNLAL